MIIILQRGGIMKKSIILLALSVVFASVLISCSSISKEEIANLSTKSVYVIFNAQKAPDKSWAITQNGWIAASAFMKQDLQEQMNEAYFNKVFFIKDKNEYIKGDNNYLLIVNFINYTPSFKKAVNGDYELYLGDKQVYKKEFYSDAFKWKKMLSKINAEIVTNTQNSITNKQK